MTLWRGRVRDTEGVVHGYDSCTIGSFEDDMTDCNQFFFPNYPAFPPRRNDRWDYVKKTEAITCPKCILMGPVFGASDYIEWKWILGTRKDIHPSRVQDHLKKLHECCRISPGMRTINGEEYYLICGEPRGHDGDHIDLEGGVSWSRG